MVGSAGLAWREDFQKLLKISRATLESQVKVFILILVSRKYLDKKNWTTNIFDQRNLEPQKFEALDILFVEKNKGPQKILGLKKI